MAKADTTPTTEAPKVIETPTAIEGPKPGTTQDMGGGIIRTNPPYVEK